MTEDRQRALVQPLLLRTDEVASLLGIGRTKVFELLSSGELPAIRIGRSVRISREHLEAWIDEALGASGLIRRLPADEPPRVSGRP